MWSSQRVTDERSAEARLDDGVDGVAGRVLAANDLIEAWGCAEVNSRRPIGRLG